jgi:hypothetical protein
MYACTDQAVSSQGCPRSKKKPETHKQAGKQNQPQLTETHAQRNTQREHTNQHAKAEGQRDRVVPAVPPNNTCARLFVENYSDLTAEARLRTIVTFRPAMAAEPVETVRACCCDLTMLTYSNTR